MHDAILFCPALLYRKTEMMHIDTELQDLSVSQKKGKKRKRETQREAEDAHGDDTGDKPVSQASHDVVLEKSCKPSTGKSQGTHFL